MESKTKYTEGATWDNGLSEESLNALNPNSLTNLHQNMEEKWGDIHMDYRHRYPELAHEDLTYLPGQFDELMKRIATMTSRTQQDVLDELEHWTPSLYKRYDQ